MIDMTLRVELIPGMIAAVRSAPSQGARTANPGKRRHRRLLVRRHRARPDRVPRWVERKPARRGDAPMSAKPTMPMRRRPHSNNLILLTNR
jgi:hypothetical protein